MSLSLVLLALLLGTERPDAAAPDFAPTLSASGLFDNLRTLTPKPDLVAYDINQAFWSDGAAKRRWIGLPPGAKIRFESKSEWHFPVRTVLVKHFESSRDHPIETRVLYIGLTNVTGASYRWRSDLSDADLLQTNLLVNLSAGEDRQTWYFPSREDCRTCHNVNAGLVLGVNTRQLNRLDQSGRNQLQRWSQLGLFSLPLASDELTSADRLVTHSLEQSVRAYLDVNCGFCHRAGGSPSYFDARWSSDFHRLLEAPVLFNQGLDGARVVAPHDPWRSILLLRLASLDGLKMPPLAHERVDTEAVAQLRSWIDSLPGPEVVPPPTLSPGGGEFRGAVIVTLQSAEAASIIRFTTNGAAPGKNSPIYTDPIVLRDPTTIRARAYKEGATRSIPVQETYVVNP